MPLLTSFALYPHHSDVYALASAAIALCRCQFSLFYHYFNLLQVGSIEFESSAAARRFLPADRAVEAARRNENDPAAGNALQSLYAGAGDRDGGTDAALEGLSKGSRRSGADKGGKAGRRSFAAKDGAGRIGSGERGAEEENVCV